MAQAFRQMPRRMGSRPSQLRNITATHGEGPEIQKLLRQSSQLQHQIKQLPSQSAALGILKKRLTGMYDMLHHLRSEARATALKQQHKKSHADGQAAQAFFQSLYTEKHPLPKHLKPLLLAALPQQANLEHYHNALHPLYEALLALEQEAWQKFWQLWLDSSPTAPADTTDTAAGSTDFEVLAFDTPSLTPTPAPRKSTPGNSGLEVAFDLQSKRSTLRNAMGISLHTPKFTYGEYLQQGFQSIDEAVASQFKERYHLERGVRAFLEAVSLDKRRHEAYFGLGYLYALVQDAKHALYFLDIAYKISHDPKIGRFQLHVRENLSAQRHAPTQVQVSFPT